MFVVEDAERLWQRLRLANAEHERLPSMGERWWRIVARHAGEQARALLYRLGPERFVDRVLLAWTRSQAGAADDALARARDVAAALDAPVFPLKAADFMARGVGKGPALGAALRAAEEAWIAADFPSDEGDDRTIADARLAVA